MIRRASESAAAVAAALAVLLASTALASAYTNWTFMLPVLSAVVVAFGLGWLGRRLDVPASLAPAVSFVGFIEYLTITYFRDSAFLAVIPTPEVFRAAGLVIQQGARDINQLAAPVVPTRELLFITVAGVFAVAVVVDLIALRMRRPVLAGLPLLTLFVIPSSLSPTGAGWAPFALASAGYLGLLTIEGRDRVHRWGRRLAAQRVSADDGYRKPVARAARGIGAAAIGFALVIPGLTPGLENGLLAGTGGSTGQGSVNGKDRGKRSTTISPVVELNKLLTQSEEVELIRVKTDVPQYLRTAVLDNFTGLEWRASKTAKDRLDANKPIALPPGLTDTVGRQVVRTEIRNSNRHSGQYLPAPYSPSSITGLKGKGNWRYDDANRVISSSNKSINGLAYTVESVVVTPDPLALDDGIPYPEEIKPYTVLAAAAKVDPAVEAEARRVTRRASTNWGRVVALQNWFSRDGGFEYSLTRQPGTGGDVLKAFLRDRVGYCEQYAAAMAVMVRSLGIPSRVVVGFTAGTPTDDYYSITNRDAHAWPEVYFSTVGWVRFEPTPPGSNRAAVNAPDETSIIPTAAPTPSESASASAPVVDPGTGLSRLPNEFNPERIRPDLTANQDFLDIKETNRRPLLIAAVLFLALLVPIVPALTRSTRRRRARRGAATPRTRSHVAWQHMQDDAHDLGFGWPSSASPRVAATSLIAAARLDDAVQKAVRRLASAEENARYAPASYAAASSPDFDSDVAVVRAALLSVVSTRLRLRAVVFPASTLSVISRSVHIWTAGAGSRVARLMDKVPPLPRMRAN